MEELLIIVLAALALYLAWRLRRLHKLMKGLVVAAETKRPFLAPSRSGSSGPSHIAALIQHFNALVAGNAEASKQEKGYLQQIDTTLTNLSEVVLILDERNQLRLANAAARELLGFEVPARGQRLETFLHSSGFLEFMERIKSGERVERREITILQGKKTLTFEVSGAPVPSAGEGSENLYLFVMHDITRLKRLEGVRREFVANVSHELRTPVTIIKGFADTLVDDCEQISRADLARFLEKIKKNVDRLHLLLEDLLTLSRLEGRSDGLQKGPHSLEQIIREVAENFQSKLKPPHERLQFDLRSGADVVPCDPIKLSQVFQNLLDNITRYAKGFTTITIRTRSEEDYVRVSVEDNGCGVPEEDRQHIFERFYRVDKGRSREHGGTGLGLSIVKHIVQMHGGDAIATESPEGGLAIQFTLPREPESGRGVPREVEIDATAGKQATRAESEQAAAGSR